MTAKCAYHDGLEKKIDLILEKVFNPAFDRG
jgi:hypothetical protein